jgi:hypothetical protein
VPVAASSGRQSETAESRIQKEPTSYTEPSTSAAVYERDLSSGTGTRKTHSDSLVAQVTEMMPVLTAFLPAFVIDHLTTVREVERRSGLSFFWQLPHAQEDAIKASKDRASVQSWLN